MGSLAAVDVSAIVDPISPCMALCGPRSNGPVLGSEEPIRALPANLFQSGSCTFVTTSAASHSTCGPLVGRSSTMNNGDVGSSKAFGRRMPLGGLVQSQYGTNTSAVRVGS